MKEHRDGWMYNWQWIAFRGGLGFVISLAPASYMTCRVAARGKGTVSTYGASINY
jgi:hypothetical protein